MSPYWNWTIGNLLVSFFGVNYSDDRIDAHNFFESSFWNGSDPLSGLGGWGDPDDDYSVHDGGFRDLILAYPVPHHVRRNFTILAWEDIPSPLVIEPLKLGNTSFTPSVVEAILDTPSGEYKEFQKELEALQVRNRI